MAYSALKWSTADMVAAAQKSQPRGLAGDNNSADDREAKRDEGVPVPEFVDVGVWMREVQGQEKEA